MRSKISVKVSFVPPGMEKMTNYELFMIFIDSALWAGSFI